MDPRACYNVTFTANNSGLDNCAQRTLDRQTGAADGDDPSGLDTTTVGGGLQAISINSSEHEQIRRSPSLYRRRLTLDFDFAAAPARSCTTRRHPYRKRKRALSCDINSLHQEQLAGEMGSLSTLSSDMLDKINRIAGPEILATLWYCLRAQRESSLNRAEGIVEMTGSLDDSVKGI